MQIIEFENTTDFVFVSDFYIDNNFQCHFDTTYPDTLTQLLAQHNITRFDIHLDINHLHQRTVTIRVHEPLDDPFYYDLSTTKMYWNA